MNGIRKAIVKAIRKYYCKCGNHVFSPAVENFSDPHLWNNNGTIIGVYTVENRCIFCDEHYSSHAFVPMPFVTCEGCKYYREGELLAPTRFCFRCIGNDGKPFGMNMSDMDFCSYGKRKDE